MVVLPVPFTPTARITVGFARMSIGLPDPGGLGQQLDQPLAESLAALELSFARLGLERAHDRGGRGRADVGHDQRLLQAFPGVLVERPEQRRLDL